MWGNVGEHVSVSAGELYYSYLTVVNNGLPDP